ncbi:MAG TPA: hypothetical protein VK163_01175 [Opitutaceae bacterium]|nr:hypothetical protein [Opitutaceae bacterium]
MQLVTAETIAAGFPFGIRLNVFADTPETAIEAAEEQLRRFSASVTQSARVGLAAELSRVLTGA